MKAKVPEPIWIVDEFDGGYSTAVCGQWPDGVRHAIALYAVGESAKAKMTKKLLNDSKRQLREWYREKHLCK